MRRLLSCAVASLISINSRLKHRGRLALPHRSSCAPGLTIGEQSGGADICLLAVEVQWYEFQGLAKN